VLDKGTPEYEVVRNFPDILHAETAEGTVVVSGFWDCPDYDENRAGRYTFRFNASGLPEGYTDSYGHMTATVVIKDDEKNDSSAKEKGCGSDMAMEGTAALLLAGAATLKKRRGKR
ncbi:MAG: hypothetical protein IJU84_01745, partial [Clostridia bacterium]|nr:hypothetical protein [Clostridia bacterium]